MADEPKKKGRGPRKRVEPIFITKSEMAQLMSVADTKTIDSWVEQRRFPPPHSQPGRRLAVWLREHWLYYVEHGEWPKEAFPEWRGW